MCKILLYLRAHKNVENNGDGSYQYLMKGNDESLSKKPYTPSEKMEGTAKRSVSGKKSWLLKFRILA